MCDPAFEEDRNFTEGNLISFGDLTRQPAYGDGTSDNDQNLDQSEDENLSRIDDECCNDTERAYVQRFGYSDLERDRTISDRST